MESKDSSINLSDIKICLNIIDICSQRGAFKGDELSSIGQIRDKLEGIVKQYLPADEETTIKEQDQ
jgi:hypothetical protein